MAFFPFFMELEGRTGCIVGGGRTALEKSKRLLDYGPKLVVVAPKVLPEFEDLPHVELVRRPFHEDDMTDRLTFAVAATDCAQTNREVAALCRERRIPVNVVDMPEECSFLFPSLVRRGNLSIGISTGGASPSAAIHIKREINALLPDAIDGILDWLNEQREPIKTRIRSGAVRKAVFHALFEEGMRQNRPLTPAETQTLIETVEREETR